MSSPQSNGQDKKKAAIPARELQQFKEIIKALHWVVITGVLDHAKLVANYREALRNLAVANPHYARLELERQVRQKDLSWSDWEKVDAEENLKILDNLPEEDEELTPENVRPDNLNDPLPSSRPACGRRSTSPAWSPGKRRRPPVRQPWAGRLG